MAPFGKLLTVFSFLLLNVYAVRAQETAKGIVFHDLNATVSGSWWCGLKDETGIPHATMNDGAPNGYTFLKFDGTAYELRFKAARRPAAYQMNIYLEDDIEKEKLDRAKVVVNVFSGSQRSVVEMKVAGREDWFPLDFSPMQDPYNV